MEFIEDDRFLAVTGSFASVFNALGRIMWGKLADRFSFRVSFLTNWQISHSRLRIGLNTNGSRDFPTKIQQ